MADTKVPEQYNTLYTLGVQAGIKRDGTTFEAREFSAGEWCRFQRMVPKKIGGYRELFSTFNGIPRGMVSNAYSGVNYVFTGNNQGIDVFTTGTTFGVGAGPFAGIINKGYSNFAVTSYTTTTFTITSATAPIAESLVSKFPAGTKVIFSQSANPTVYTTVGTPTHPGSTTVVTFTPAYVGAITNVWLADTSFAADDRLLWQFDLQYQPSGGALKLLAHGGYNLANIDSGIKTPVLYGDIFSNSSNQWNFYILADSGGQNPTYKPISVSGGVCVLYPYIFVYGDNGFIANNHVDSSLANYSTQGFTDWNGATANQVNMASSKVVKGIPVRGGTNSPSGLFWATDSLIRASFTGTSPLYWRYDIISSQISIMSSSSVAEMDGVYYWMGVDRYYQYNGSVSVLPNDKNVNWLFDNLNYEQRQKVWATKVPRFNEIWFFYPRGTDTECTDAIIYNVKDKIWYDAGSAVGARRSCGWTTEIFPTPIWAGWELTTSYSPAYTVITNPASLPAPTSSQIYISGDVSVLFSPGDYLSFSTNPTAAKYLITTSTHIFNATIGTPGVTRITCSTAFSPAVSIGQSVYYVQGGYSLWQQEYGTDEISFFGTTAINSSFTTCDISWVGGNPNQDAPQGVNRRIHLRRIEPDFVQSGTMSLTMIGDKFARGDHTYYGPYYFDPDTGKIDLRVESREILLQFTSNTIGGHFEMGRILVTAEYGDERP